MCELWLWKSGQWSELDSFFGEGLYLNKLQEKDCWILKNRFWYEFHWFLQYLDWYLCKQFSAVNCKRVSESNFENSISDKDRNLQKVLKIYHCFYTNKRIILNQPFWTKLFWFIKHPAIPLRQTQFPCHIVLLVNFCSTRKVWTPISIWYLICTSLSFCNIIQGQQC